MLDTKIEDNIMVVTFTNGKTNSITKKSLDDLKEAVVKANQDKSIKGIILTGQERFFSSGFDLYTFMGFEKLSDAVDFISYADEVFLELFLSSKPVVCAINGHAAAGGLILAMASDYRIVVNHPKIKLGMSEIKIGVPLSVAQSAIMRFGLDSDKKFRDVMYFGDMVDVPTALRKEIVDEVVEADELIGRAKSIISTWFDTPGRPFSRIKEELKKDTADRIKKRMSETDWHHTLNCFFNPQVKEALAFVQSRME
ncbi:MAG: enoyl-CoA hydratase/isomerase family protein [Desulfamplus sp.]|nr:enoyl-CoA hydratase/isomerase family protein [Desulfamplus sp.]